jgi:hypothetical protein
MGGVEVVARLETTNAPRSPKIFSEVLTAAGGVEKVRGFAVNVSNYNILKVGSDPSKGREGPCPDELTYVQKLSEALAAVGIKDKGYIIDTSRNGRGGIRDKQGSWCNVKGAGLGERPQVAPAPLVDAYAWLKTPGESDGTSKGRHGALRRHVRGQGRHSRRTGGRAAVLVVLHRAREGRCAAALSFPNAITRGVVSPDATPRHSCSLRRGEPVVRVANRPEDPFHGRPEDPSHRPEDPCELPEDLFRRRDDVCELPKDLFRGHDDPIDRPEDPFRGPDDACELPEDLFRGHDDPFEGPDDPFVGPDDPFEMLGDLFNGSDDRILVSATPCSRAVGNPLLHDLEAPDVVRQLGRPLHLNQALAHATPPELHDAVIAERVVAAPPERRVGGDRAARAALLGVLAGLAEPPELVERAI